MDGIWSGVVASALGLVLVLALAWLVLRGLRRFGGLGGADAGGHQTELRVLRTLALGPRERLVLVRCGDAELVLGVTAHGIGLLHRLPGPAPGADAAGAPAPGEREPAGR